MSTPWNLRSLALLLSLSLIACTTATTQSPTASPSSTNSPNQITPPTNQTANRVVALTSLSADIIQRLARSKLVAIPGSRLLKQDTRFQGLPTVSEGRTMPNLEAIVNLKPNLVIGAVGIHDQTLRKLERLGIQTFQTELKSWDSLGTVTRAIAQHIDADPTPLLQEYQSLLTDIPTQSPSTLILASHQPILAPNKNSWAGDLLTQFRAKNVAADLQGQSVMAGYITLSPEKLLEANPRVLILVNIEQDIAKKFKSESFWNQLQAVQANRVYVLDYYGLVNPGSIDAIKQACNQLKQALKPEAN